MDFVCFVDLWVTCTPGGKSSLNFQVQGRIFNDDIKEAEHIFVHRLPSPLQVIARAVRGEVRS